MLREKQRADTFAPIQWLKMDTVESVANRIELTSDIEILSSQMAELFAR
jgi:hypothetical protein